MHLTDAMSPNFSPDPFRSPADVESQSAMDQLNGLEASLAETIEPLPRHQNPSVEPLARITQEHASPLLPMRARDMQALIELFQQDEIAAIEADILQNLRQRSPELYWEDLATDVLNSL